MCTPSRARHGCIAIRRGIPIGKLSQADDQSLGGRFGDIPRIRFWGLSPPEGIAVFAIPVKVSPLPLKAEKSVACSLVSMSTGTGLEEVELPQGCHG